MTSGRVAYLVVSIDSRTARPGNTSVDGTGSMVAPAALRSPAARAPRLAVTAPMHMTPHLDHHFAHLEVRTTSFQLLAVEPEDWRG